MKASIAVVLAVMMIPAAWAQKEAPLPKDLPPLGSQPVYQPPAVAASKLGNGLTVWLIPEAGVPKVSLLLRVRGGFAADPADRPGIAELLATTVGVGTRTRTARQLAEQLQLAGGNLDTGADRDNILLSTSVLSSKLKPALAILSDLAQNASFPGDEVELARSNLKESLQQREAQPRFQASRALARAVFGSGPYSVIAPPAATVEKMTAEELRREYTRRFRPEQSILVVVGDFNTGVVRAQISQQFGSWKASGQGPVPQEARPAGGSVAHAVTVVPRPGSVQTALVLGGFGPLRRDADYEAAEVANAVYGGTFSSRLVENIREDKGYTYSPGSSVVTLRQAGLVQTRADVRNAVTGASLNEIVYELNRMVTTAPTQEELERAKRYLLGIEAVSLQSRAETASEYSDLWLDGLDAGALAQSLRKLDAIQLKEVEAAAHKYFPASRMAIIAVGDEKLIHEQLAPFGLPFREDK